MFRFRKTPSNKFILHAGFHKCLTVYFQRVFLGVASRHQLEWKKITRKDLDQATLLKLRESCAAVTMVFHADDVTDQVRERYFPGIKGSHVIRDPRDLVISAAFYHHICDEKWCRLAVEKVLPPQTVGTLVQEFSLQEPDSGDTYQSYLQKHSVEESFIIELLRMTESFKALRNWDYSNPDFIEIRYEEIIGNEKETFARIFRHYGFPRSWIRTGVDFADRLSLGNNSGNIKHVRSGKIAQWKKAFSPLMKDIFKEHQGDLLIHLGYETGFDW